MKLLGVFLSGVAATLLLIGAGTVVVATMGLVDVGATRDYLPGVEWVVSTLSENSIQRHAVKAIDDGKMSPPAEVTSSMLASGRHHYVEMCVVCHGAPGVDRGELGAGLKPLPPDMQKVAAEMSMAEIYWVLDHGIRHTGMPSYGATHSPEELWAIAAFVEELATMTPEEYARQTRPAESSGASSASGGETGDGHEGHSH